MAVEEGLRRSTRAKKQVKSYADEQAESEERAFKSKPATKRKKQQPEKHLDDEHDGDDGYDVTVTDGVEKAPPKKKSKKKISEDDADNDYDVKDDAVKAPPKKKGKKNSKDENDVVRADGSIKNGLSLFFDGVDRAPEGASWHADAAERRIAASKRNVKKLAPGQKETRLRSFVEDASETYKKALKKANSERMFILSRERGVESDCHHSHSDHDDCPKETLEIAGSTGNVYTVEITHAPTCTCPVGIFKRKNQETLCKHALYILHNVLKAPEYLKQQNAFLSSELKEIFANAAPLAPAEAPTNSDAETDGGRKAIEGDCPICFMEFEEGEDIVWCRAACGNNIHKGCFDQWAGTRGYNVTCPFCRSAWEKDGPKQQQTQKIDVMDVDIPEARGKSGYRNVRALLDYGD